MLKLFSLTFDRIWQDYSYCSSSRGFERSFSTVLWIWMKDGYGDGLCLRSGRLDIIS